MKKGIFAAVMIAAGILVWQLSYPFFEKIIMSFCCFMCTLFLLMGPGETTKKKK